MIYGYYCGFIRTAKLLRRLLAVLIVAVLAGSLLPAAAYAADTMTISGQITDELDQPVLNSEVILYLLDTNGDIAEELGRIPSAGNEGYYSFENIPVHAGYLTRKYLLEVFNPGESGNYSSVTDFFTYGQVTRNFKIQKHGSSVIQVLDESGSPVPAGIPMWFSYTSHLGYKTDWPWNAPSDCRTRSPHHVTDSDGRIGLYLNAVKSVDGTFLGGADYACPAGFFLEAAVGKIDQTYNMVDLEGVDHTSEYRYECPRELEQYRTIFQEVSSQVGTTSYYDIYVRPLGKVTAHAMDGVTEEPKEVFWSYSTGMSFAKYQVWSEDGSSFSTYCYGGDTITIEAKDQPNPLTGHLGHQTASASVEVDSWGFEEVTLTLEPNTYGTISGRVIDGSSDAIAGATVELLLPEQGEGGGLVYHTLQTILTDNEGCYTFTNVVPTTEWYSYTIRAKKTDYGIDRAENILLDSGQELVIGNMQIARDEEPPYWEEYHEIDVISIGRTAVKLKWVEAIDDTGIEGYKIYQGETLLADTGLDYERDFGSVVRYMVKNLEAGTTYNFSIRAYDAVDNLSQPLSVSFATLADYDSASKVIRVSVNSDGMDANDESQAPVISADGRFVVFESKANNLYDRDTNRYKDIFLFDRGTGQIKCLSLNPQGETGDWKSESPAISADGRYVAFASSAEDLVPGDTNDRADIFVYDTETDSLELVSTSLNGAAASDHSYTPSLSSDGRYVAFCSIAGNLVEGDTNGTEDIFVRDRVSGTTTRVSYGLDGSQLTASTSNPVISGNGGFVAYEIYQDFKTIIYVYDIETGTSELVTRSYDDASVACEGYNPSISHDGRYIAFHSAESGLVESDTNGKTDVFVYDRVNKTMQLASLSGSGEQGNGSSWSAAISADGCFVAFKSGASNMVEGDTNGCDDVFIRDLTTGSIERASVAGDGTQGNSDSSFNECPPAISADGQFIAFDSYASNLVPGDGNDRCDIFIYDGGAQQETRPPELSETGVSAITDTTADLSFTSDKAGTYYYLVYTAADPAPDAAAIKTQGEAAAKGQGVASAGLNSVEVADLSPSTAYKAYLMVVDALNNASSIAIFDITTTASEFAGGDGSKENPYEVATAAQLNNVRKYLNQHFRQTENIDLNVAPYNQETGWEPIGISGNPFAGTYDGNGFTISNLFIDLQAKNENYVGLFGYADHADIRNVRMLDVNVTGQYQVGGLAGEIGSDGAVTSCYATGQVAGDEDVGGLVGLNQGTITGCYASATVNGKWGYVGGLAGENRHQVISSYATGDVTGNKYVGGLVGSNWGYESMPATITESYSTGAVKGRTSEATDLGGLVGKIIYGNVQHSYWDTETSGKVISAGGIGMTTSMMKKQENYADWDFVNTWGIDADENNGYPFLALVVAVPDTEPPVWAEGFPKAVDITASGITLKAKIDEDGTAYYVVLAGGSASPSSQQVKSGKDSSDNPVADGRKGSISLTADTVGNTSIFGLDSDTAYDLYAVAQDTADNLQSVPRKLQFTTKTSASVSPGTGSGGVATYTISVTAGTGGTITPKTFKVKANAAQTFTITPDPGYEIEDVLVDGKSIGAKTSYTFNKVTGEHTISATFKKVEETVEDVPVIELPFKDVHENNWFYNSVKYAYEKGLMQGTGLDTFSPFSNTSRAMIVTILHRLEKTPAGLGDIFNDVAEGTWYKDAVAWAAANGIVGGYGGNRFGPNDSITREQMACILYRYAKYAGYDVSQSGSLTGFTDGGQTSKWAVAAMEWAVGSGLIQGKDGNILDPAGLATRAEAATILQRFIENNAK